MTRRDIATALGLAEDATNEAILGQASGLVTAVRTLRGRVYVGIINSVLDEAGVVLPDSAVQTPDSA